MPVPERVRSAVTAGRLAHRVTLNTDGSPQVDNPPPGYVLHIMPERFSGVGPWTDAAEG